MTNRPLKVVPQLERDYYKPDGGGGPKKIFGEVTSELRDALVLQVNSINEYFSQSFTENPDLPAVACLKIKPDAIAKSHRPISLFSAQTCPIIGAEGLGELLISVTPQGLSNLNTKIASGKTKQIVANISTLVSLSPFLPDISNDVFGSIKVKLFRHQKLALDSEVDTSFQELLTKYEVEGVNEINYGGGLKIYRIPPSSIELVDALKTYVGTQSLGQFPMYQPVRSSAIKIRAIADQDFPAPDLSIDYPTIGIIDSGTNEIDKFLSPWRVAREVYVPQSEQDTSHGSFVAGLTIHSRKMNHGDVQFPECSSKFVDVVALSKTGTSEDKLLTILEDVIPKYPDVNVWNLSLGTTRSVVDSSFSDLAVALDRLQEQYKITFVIAAGNYQTAPFRDWPPTTMLGESDRICAPADSLRSIVVGSITHRDHASSRVIAGSPSPFTRRGPGPLYLPKPDLSHLGGNCDATGVCTQIGVLSIDGNGNLVEDLGTSFAAPLVTTMHANLTDRVAEQTSSLMARALLVHSAAKSSGRIDPELLRYNGFGVPQNIDTLLACESWECTMTFEIEIPTSVAYEKSVFPMPKSLFISNEVLKANILMTLVYDPEMDGSFGSEYCRSNIEVSLGTHKVGKDGVRHHKKQVPEDPILRGKAYEKDLVAHGFKWSPVKVYRREMVRGIGSDRWRLDLSVQHRSAHLPVKKNRAALVITISDPNKKAPVYNEMVAQMNNLGWSAVDLKMKGRLKI